MYVRVEISDSSPGLHFGFDFANVNRKLDLKRLNEKRCHFHEYRIKWLIKLER